MSQATRTSVTHATQAWYPLCWSRSLRDRPLHVRVFGRPLVVFRSGNGAVGVFDDRCPHRNVPLSRGSVVDGELQCVYHGWRFNHLGECTQVPGLCEEQPSPSARHTRAYPTQESQGIVWVWPSHSAPERAPFLMPTLDERYTALDIDVSAQASLQQTIENALDVPHTAFLHRGLFRTGAGRTISVRIVSARDRVEAIYENEDAPDGLVGRILAPGGGQVEHSDRFILPSIQQVEYRIGDDAHVLITGACLPVEARETKMFVRILYRTRLPDRILGKVLKPLGLKIFQQDAEILRAQTETIAAFGEERFVSTALDVLGSRILRLLRALEAGTLDELDPEEERTLTMRV